MEEVYNFYETHYFENIKPVKEATESIDILSKEHELKIITFRQHDMKQKTGDWTEKNFQISFQKSILQTTSLPMVQA